MAHSLAFALAVVVWWFSTGIIALVCTRQSQTFGWNLACAAAVLGLSLFGLGRSAWIDGDASVCAAFLSGLGIWGCVEMSFLMGYVTGPRRSPCPDDAQGWRRFGLALQTVLYHELAIAVAATGVVALTWGAPNQFGTLAFLILMAMRISAKLNIFLGVPNLSDELLPQRLVYLKTYFRRSEPSILLPVSILASMVVAGWLAYKMMGSEGAEATGFALLFALVALAILEHFFMIIPLPDAILWRWALPEGPVKPADEPLP